MTEFHPADVHLVSEAWKNAPCHHHKDSVCVPCMSVAVLRALDAAGRLAANGRCGHSFSTGFGNGPPLVCALPAGHGGWHREGPTEWGTVREEDR